MTEVRAASENNPWLMKNAGQYKFPKALSDTDLRRPRPEQRRGIYTAFWALFF